MQQDIANVTGSLLRNFDAQAHYTLAERVSQFVQRPYQSPMDMDRREIELERAEIMSLLPNNIVRALHDHYKKNVSLRQALRQNKSELPACDQKRYLFRRYMELTHFCLSQDIIQRIAYGESQWVRDQMEILDKSLARKSKRVHIGDQVEEIRVDNLAVANKAQELLAKKFGFLEQQESATPTVQHNTQNVTNITKIDVTMPEEDATQIYRRALKDG